MVNRPGRSHSGKVHLPASNFDVASRERFFRILLAYVFSLSLVALSPCTVGAVRSLGDPGEPRARLETADNAMHAAKSQGRGRLFATVAVGSLENEEGP